MLESLEVLSVPIYIQEKIHPQAIIETLREEAKTGESQDLGLFNDFNGIKFEDKTQILPARAALAEPHDPRQFPPRHELARR